MTHSQFSWGLEKMMEKCMIFDCMSVFEFERLAGLMVVHLNGQAVLYSDFL